MDAARKKQLIDGGVDVDDALARFMGNEALLTRFLDKFPANENYGNLVAALADDRKEDAITACHALKGVCGNLSLTALFDLVNRQLIAMRADDWQTAAALMDDITAGYSAAVAAITAK